PDAREDATNAALMAELAASRKRAEREGWISGEELAARTAATPEEVAAARAELDALEAAETHAHRRASAPRPTVPNGKLLLRVPSPAARTWLARPWSTPNPARRPPARLAAPHLTPLVRPATRAKAACAVATPHPRGPPVLKPAKRAAHAAVVGPAARVAEERP